MKCFPPESWNGLTGGHQSVDRSRMHKSEAWHFLDPANARSYTGPVNLTDNDIIILTPCARRGGCNHGVLLLPMALMSFHEPPANGWISFYYFYSWFHKFVGLSLDWVDVDDSRATVLLPWCEPMSFEGIHYSGWQQFTRRSQVVIVPHGYHSILTHFQDF